MLVINNEAIAQNLRGKVRDINSGEALTGATIVIKGTTKGAVADLDGNFQIVDPGKPPFVLVVSFLGYAKQEKSVENIGDLVLIKMTPLESRLDEVEVVDTRLTEKQRESPLTVEAMDLLAIKETPAANFYDGLGSLKGVDLTAASLGFKIINTRGFNSTSPVRSLQLIDGVDNQAPGLNFSLGNFLGSSELDVQKVDIIVGASSAFYGPNAFNGVISMTTKNPFDYTGLSAMVKTGERGLVDLAVRYAQKYKDKQGQDCFAFKLNLAYMQALDWMADNTDPTEQSLTGKSNPGGYDAVNRYGDEELGGFQYNYTSTQLKSIYPGLGAIYRNGYAEKDLVDYDTRNLKASLAAHYRIKPDLELIYSSSFGTGSTIYQGENRFRLENILFFQNRLELVKKDKFFIRAYATNENAGDSYDAVVTAFELQNLSKSNNAWKEAYQNGWVGGGLNAPRFIVRNLAGYPTPFNEQVYDSVIAANQELIQGLHDKVRTFANKKSGLNTYDFFVPGTTRFDSALAAVKSRTLANRGSLLRDRSALYHLHGEYKFDLRKFAEFTTGANIRIYRPNSDGTIFSDTLVIDQISAGDTTYKRRIITNAEAGAYIGAQKKFMDEKLKVNATLRVDKNQNFRIISTQSVSGVYTHQNNHTFRLVFSSAIRNPTLADQYLFYNVGRAILLGNISGKDSLVRINSFFDYLDNLDVSKLQYFNVARLQPERVMTFEAGYRATLFKKVFVDMSYYYSIYHDFIGYKVGLDVDFTSGLPMVQAYRLAANTNDIVYTMGFSAGINYYFREKYSFSGNYSFNQLSRPDSTDEIITAFNTPLNKFNIGFNGRKMRLPWIKGEHFGFNFNYKWVQGFTFEGSPQFTGSIPSYGMLDGQISWNITRFNTQIKLGASNLLNNKVYMVYGGPLIGRLAYVSLLVDLTD
jgi:iron complex outermembrane recepter protein